MSHLETLIYRYLDGELTSEEIDELHRLLDRSPEAESLLREIASISWTARKTSDLHIPPADLESKLFADLNAEGFRGNPVPASLLDSESPRRAPRQPASNYIARAATALVLLLLGIIGNHRTLVESGEHAVRTRSMASLATPARTPRLDFGALVPVPALTMAPQDVPGATRRFKQRGPNETGRLASAIQAPPTETPSEASSDSVERPILSAAATIGPPTGPPTATTPQIDPPATRITFIPDPSPSRSNGAFSVTAASGMTYINKGAGAIGREITIRLNAPLGGGHEISLIAGQSPSVTETHRNWIDTRSKSLDSKGERSQPLRITPEPLPDYEVQVDNRAWMGVGYNYAMQVDDRTQMLPGMKVGVGTDFWRVGVEIPTRYRVSTAIAVEFTATASRTVPHDRSTRPFTMNDFERAYYYYGDEQNSAFTSIGMQLGVSVNLE